MNAIIKQCSLSLDNEEMRKVYASTMLELARANENIVALDADLVSCIGMDEFQKAYPNRMFNCGIQEANMIGVASGLSLVKKIPFAHTFTPFATRRCFDQVFLSAGYAKANIKIIGSDPGITATYNGGTHMSFEDIALMKVVPNITIIEPSDNVMLKNLLSYVANKYGNFYIRIMRKNPFSIYENNSQFEIGKAVQIMDGKDATIIASGSIMLANAIDAANNLKKNDAISVRVLDMFTIKPIDKYAIVKSAQETGAIVTVENHNIINGLGSSVADILAENNPVPMGKIGISDRFGQVGSLEFLEQEYHLTSDDIALKVKETISRK